MDKEICLCSAGKLCVPNSVIEHSTTIARTDEEIRVPSKSAPFESGLIDNSDTTAYSLERRIDTGASLNFANFESLESQLREKSQLMLSTTPG